MLVAAPCEDMSIYTPAQLGSQPSGFPSVDKSLIRLFNQNDYELEVSVKINVRILANGKPWVPKLDKRYGLVIETEDMMMDTLPTNKAESILDNKASHFESFSDYAVSKTGGIRFIPAMCGETKVMSDVKLLFTFIQVDNSVSVLIED